MLTATSRHHNSVIIRISWSNLRPLQSTVPRSKHQNHCLHDHCLNDQMTPRVVACTVHGATCWDRACRDGSNEKLGKSKSCARIWKKKCDDRGLEVGAPLLPRCTKASSRWGSCVRHKPYLLYNNNNHNNTNNDDDNANNNSSSSSNSSNNNNNNNNDNDNNNNNKPCLLNNNSSSGSSSSTSSTSSNSNNDNNDSILNLACLDHRSWRVKETSVQTHVPTHVHSDVQAWHCWQPCRHVQSHSCGSQGSGTAATTLGRRSPSACSEIKKIVRWSTSRWRRADTSGRRCSH